jgi:phage shock protein E
MSYGGSFRIYFYIIAVTFIIISLIFPSYRAKVCKGITPEEVKKLMNSDISNVMLIDVRTPEEYISGHIKGSINLPLQILGEEVTARNLDKNTKIIVYCKSGVRSKKAVEILRELNYTDVSSMGGINKWPYELEK